MSPLYFVYLYIYKFSNNTLLFVKYILPVYKHWEVASQTLTYKHWEVASQTLACFRKTHVVVGPEMHALKKKMYSAIFMVAILRSSITN